MQETASAMSEQAIGEVVRAFNRDGCSPPVDLLPRDLCDELISLADRIFDDPLLDEKHTLYSDITIARLFEWDEVFRDLAVREPMISVVEAILGENCHLIANNLVRNPPGRAIDFFHADDDLIFPLPEDVPRFDPRVTIPTLVVNVQIPLTHIPDDAHGPMQYVPGSHYSGRSPDDRDAPTFEGRGPVSIHARAGQFYLQHSQVWHRGGPNTSETTRYVLQYAFGKRYFAQRFYPFVNYQMPEHITTHPDARLRRVFGEHGKGAWG